MSGAEFRRFAADLARAAAGLESSAEKRVDRVAKRALATARSAAPVDTGDLRAGLKIRKEGGARVAVEVTNYYATFQEFGTSKMAPNPYIGPAVTRHGPELVKELERLADDIAKDLS